MNLYVTQIKAIDPADGEMKTWIGPNVPGISWADAEFYCETNGLGYCEVIGQLVAEIGTKYDKNGNLIADMDNISDYDLPNQN